MPDFTEMGSPPGRNKNSRGGRIISAFFIATIVSGLGIFLSFTFFGTFTETGPTMVIFVSPVIGIIAALTAGLMK